MREKTVCFTGHRIIPSEKRASLFAHLTDVITSLLEAGYRYFGAGGALGFDTLAAQAVLQLRTEYPQIRLILVLPCKEQTRGWLAADVDTYIEILHQADKVVYTAEHYYRGCMFKRNRHLVDNSSVCICYLTSDHGGTAYTVRYAQSQQLGLSIWPTAYRLSFPFRRLRFQFTAILGISEPDTFHEIGCKLAVKKIIRRCVSVSIPPIPEVESQPGDPFRSTGLPAVIDTIWADTILFKVKDFLDVVPGIAADTHDIEKGFVVGIILSRLLEHHIIKCQMFPILKTNF